MKSFKLTFVILAIFFMTNALSADKINFITDKWESVVQKAGKANKPIFIDAYTDWCGWCKVMSRKTFTDTNIIKFINDNFIAVKYEMERGEGKRLAMKYKVTGFPTTMFFSPKGKYIYNVIGYQAPEKFIVSLKASLDPENHFDLKGVSDEIDLAFPDFYKSAYGKNGSPEKKYPDKETLQKYFASQKNLFSEVNWLIISRFDVDDKINAFFLKNMDKYQKLYGEKAVNENKTDILYSYLRKAIKDKSERELEECLAAVDKYMGDKAGKYRRFYKITYYEKLENWGKYVNAIEKRIEKDDPSPNQVNEYCWTIYQKVDDPAIVKKAVGWMKAAVAKEPDYAKTDTYASLLFKAGNYPEAKIWAEKAIKLGKDGKVAVDSTEELLAKINSKLN